MPVSDLCNPEIILTGMWIFACEFFNVLFFIYSFIHMGIHWAISPLLPPAPFLFLPIPLVPKQNLFCPFLQFC
jgi:hypothetical protein